MSKTIFITGTDTDVGKTYIALGLLKNLTEKKYACMALKPVACGCDEPEGLYNADARALQKMASVQLDYQIVNPFLFKQAIAPHLAASLAGTQLVASKIAKHISTTISNHAHDVCIIEGVGGWAVPLNNTETMADVVVQLGLPVVVVVGMKLGCLNHAILTAKAIMQSGCHLIGWIANCIDPNMEAQEANIETLKSWLEVPCLGVVPYGEEVEDSISKSLFLPLQKV